VNSGGFDYCQKPKQKNGPFSRSTVIQVTKAKGCDEAAFRFNYVYSIIFLQVQQEPECLVLDFRFLQQAQP
jgi:hypothetical protein